MYFKHVRNEMVRIPPDRLGEDLDLVSLELARQTFEGRMTNDQMFSVLAIGLEKLGNGKVVHGDGAVYQPVKMEILQFKLTMQEVVEGVVDQITEYGAFIRFGPLDGLLHVSQIMDDHIDVDIGNQRLLGKDSGRELRKGDKVRARIVTISINEISPRESKIGLTMRQPGLGNLSWLEEDRKKPNMEKN